MAKNKTFGTSAGLFKETQEVLFNDVQEVQQVQEAPKIKFGQTQGKKGHKAKRINMAFSDENHAYIKTESRKRGMYETNLVNMIIDEYREVNTKN